MICNKYYCLILMFCALTFVTGCDEWDDHNKPTEEALNKTLLAAIDEESSLSVFASYLETTGYDKVLASSKTFTVWAPDNAALAGLSADIVNDAKKLSQFVGNHISYQEYFTKSAATVDRVKMINGKYLHWHGSALEDAELTSQNRYYRNGVLHVISKPVLPLLNNWDVLFATPSAKKQADFIKAGDVVVFYPDRAVQTGVTPGGEPIYAPGTGYDTLNIFKENIYDVSNEDSLSTFIILTDAAFDAETAKLTSYFKTATNSADTALLQASWLTVRDLVLPGVLTANELPDVAVSTTGIKVPIDKSAIVASYVTSNGIVHLMNKVDFRLEDKFPPIIIQGERPYAFSRSDKNNLIQRRLRNWADGGQDLRIYDVQGTGVSTFTVAYRLNNVPALTYKVYWRAVNDFVDTTVVANLNFFQQKLMIDSKLPAFNNSTNVIPASPLADFGYKKIRALKGDASVNVPEYLGDYTHAGVFNKPLYLFVTANTPTTTRDANAIEIDYIKLVPVFN